LKNYEKELPAGYTEVGRVDATDKRFARRLLIACFAVLAVFGFGIGLMIARGQRRGTLDAAALWTGWDLWIFLLLIWLYIVAHELVHGLVYKMMTGEKLTFGMTLSVAYCGVPDIYVYRKTAMLALLAPFVVFAVVFGAMVLLTGGIWRIYAWLLMALHLGGCVGDLYDTWLFLTRYTDASVLMRDSGPTQWFYAKTEER